MNVSGSAAVPRGTSGGPLAGLVVLDLSRILAGPYCTMLLADMGARVIKIEAPGRGDDTRTWGPPFIEGESAYFLSVNRNKESVTVDFKHRHGRAVLERLIERADVLVENFRPGTLQRLGLDYGTVSKQHPALVYCSIAGFGQTGPRKNESGYDAVAQAEGGLMSITGAEGESPFRVGVAISDLVAGLLAAQGITLALLVRERTGRGQYVDISLLDSTISLLTYQAQRYLTAGEVATRLGNRHPTIAPYDTFEVADGDLVLAVGNDVQFQRFCLAAGLPQLATDPRFATNAARVRHHAALRDALRPAFMHRSRAAWITTLRGAGVPCGEVRSVAEVLADPQVVARGMIAALEHTAIGTLHVLGTPIKLSETPATMRRAPPTLGQDTEAVLLEDLGFSKEEVRQFRADGAI